MTTSQINQYSGVIGAVLLKAAPFHRGCGSTLGDEGNGNGSRGGDPTLALPSLLFLRLSLQPWASFLPGGRSVPVQDGTLPESSLQKGVAGRRQSLPIVICCNSRDELDAVCAAVSNLSFISLTPLYSDLADNERALILEKFRHSSAGWNQNSSLFPGDGLESSSETKKSCMIVVTDACLPLVGAGEAPLSARVLINYELPTKKEVYLRRMSTCLAADGIVINMVVGGEVVTLRGLEESSGLVVAEMPINIPEIL